MADRGEDGYFLRSRKRKDRSIESKTGSYDEEESYSQTEPTPLRFIPLVMKVVHNSTPDSSSLTRNPDNAPFKMDKCCNGITLDQLFIRTGPLTWLMWNDPCVGPETFFAVPVRKKCHSRWSPLGSYFVTSQDHVVLIWGSINWSGFRLLMCFSHYKVEEFELSPGEKYLVTYNRPDPSDPEGLWLKFFDVTSGKGIVGVKNGGVADSSYQWPVIRWAGGKDDKYFATLSKNNTIYVYEIDTNKSIRLLGDNPLDLGDDDVVDISWSPTEPLLAVLLKGRGGKQPAKTLLLLRIPDKVKLVETYLPPGVEDCEMHWQSNGEYLAVNMYSGFKFFSIKEEGIPTDFLELEKKTLVAFAWEPSGHRFAVIHKGDKGPNQSVSFYSMGTPPGKVTKLFTLKNKEADSLFWSPRGKLIVLAGLKKCFGGKLQFFDVDQGKQITKVIKPSKANHVAWDPSGRYVATAFTIPQHKFDPNYGCVRNDPLERFHMLSSNGEFLYSHQFDYPLIQLDWRPYGGGIIDDELLKMQKNPFQDSEEESENEEG